MAENNFDSTVASLFKGMDAFISAKTVVGDAVTVKDTIILHSAIKHYNNISINQLLLRLQHIC